MLETRRQKTSGNASDWVRVLPKVPTVKVLPDGFLAFFHTSGLALLTIKKLVTAALQQHVPISYQKEEYSGR
jgi:hypothetical protein